MRDKLLFLLKYYLFGLYFHGGQGSVLDISIQGDGHSYRHDYVMIFAKGFHGSFVWRVRDFVVLCSDGNSVFLSAKILKRIFSCLTLCFWWYRV
ncbi:MAG: hypothetical protein ACLSDJ_02100 [Butyricimonas faecihominis]